MNHHIVTGATMAVAMSAVPDDLLSLASKILVSVLVGLISGAASQLAAKFVNRKG